MKRQFRFLSLLGLGLFFIDGSGCCTPQESGTTPEDLPYYPQSGWSLSGLVQALRAQGKTADAEAVQKKFKVAWADADVALVSSRF